MSTTPLHYSPYLSSLTETSFYLKREDLYPKGGGGNKARMISAILDRAKSEAATYILTAGGPHSNFNRALALMSNSLGLKLKIVLYDKNPHIQRESLNKRVCDELGTEYAICDPEQVVETIAKEIQKLRDAGERPYFIYGGGKSLEGFEAYAEVIQEILMENKLIPDLVATTLATGTTFSGLQAGIINYSPRTNLLGISVARKNEVSVPLIEQNLMEYFKLETSPIAKETIQKQILDQYTLGGYGNSNDELKSFVRDIMQNTGLILDEIYVGKALFGLVDFLKNSTDFRNKKVVFLMTGGVFNF